eukprot:2731826-Lingulodinium_polyedra.AAC.1
MLLTGACGGHWDGEASAGGANATTGGEYSTDSDGARGKCGGPTATAIVPNAECCEVLFSRLGGSSHGRIVSTERVLSKTTPIRARSGRN